MKRNKYEPVSIGSRYGRLKIKAKADTRKKPSGQNVYMWLCECDCGELKEVSDHKLKSGNTKSCGCLQREIAKNNATKHGLYESSEYKTWSAMIGRCTRKNDKRWKSYGGRGIKVCDEWMRSFDCFIKDMGFKPDERYSLDRINNDGDYEPANCRWATNSVQNHNQRIKKTNTSGIKGVWFHKRFNRWYASISINCKKKHLGSFIKKEDAIKARMVAEKELQIILE